MKRSRYCVIGLYFFLITLLIFVRVNMRADLCFSHFGPDTCLKKCKDDEMLFETIQTFKRGEFLY